MIDWLRNGFDLIFGIYQQFFNMKQPDLKICRDIRNIFKLPRLFDQYYHQQRHDEIFHYQQPHFQKNRSYIQRVTG